MEYAEQFGEISAIILPTHTKPKEPLLFLDRWISEETPQLRTIIVATA